MNSISVCMIVKNEERVLARCLESVAFADEIVVVDTGSTDRSVEIAEANGAKVFHYEWKDDFAAARNFAMDQATGDWVLQIDADEEFYRPDIPRLREILGRADIDGVHLVLRNFFPSPAVQTDRSVEDPMSHPHSVNHFPRLVRNRPENRYTGTIHEGFRELDSVLISDISIFHYGYAQEDDRKERRFERNRRMTLKNVEDNPDDPLSHYYAATTCLSAGLQEEAEQHFLKMIGMADPEHPREKHFYQMANAHLATLAVLRQEYEAVERFSRAAIRPDPEYLDPWLRLGEACFFQEKHWDAERSFRRYLDILQRHSAGARATKYSLYLTAEAHYAHFFLGRLAQLRDDDDAALRHYEKSVELKDDVWGPHFFLSELYESRNDPRSQQHLTRAIELNPDLQTSNPKEALPADNPQSFEHLHAEARDLVMKNQMADASQKLIYAMQLAPNHSGIRSDLGWVLYQLGQPRNAERLWLKALALDAGNVIARRNLAEYYFEAQNLPEARIHYESLIELMGDKTGPEILDGLADVYVAQEQINLAIPLYEKALDLAPDAAGIQAKLEQLQQPVGA